MHLHSLKHTVTVIKHVCVNWITHSWQIHRMNNYRSETLFMSYLPLTEASSSLGTV